MASWAEVREQAGELAAAVEERFGARKHCTIATLRVDGSPRISGIEVQFDAEQVTIGSMLGAVKARDLQRDPRFALHSATVDPPEDPAAWPGEAKLAGRVVSTPAGTTPICGGSTSPRWSSPGSPATARPWRSPPGTTAAAYGSAAGPDRGQ